MASFKSSYAEGSTTNTTTTILDFNYILISKSYVYFSVMRIWENVFNCHENKFVFDRSHEIFTLKITWLQINTAFNNYNNENWINLIEQLLLIQSQ